MGISPWWTKDENRSNLHHEFTDKSMPPSFIDLLWRDLLLYLNYIPFFSIFTLWFTLLINLIGMLAKTSTSEGNNYHNYLIYVYEMLGFKGLFLYYNLFNFSGWIAMAIDTLLVLPPIIFVWLPIEAFISMSKGDMVFS